jgi:cytochrome c oxidase assembly protein subunit 15
MANVEEQLMDAAQPQRGYRGPVKWWILAGVIMIIGQVVIGGITRLTGSGLSITKWEIVTGTLPPLNEAQWEEAFRAYQATPQYQKINEGMSMPDFKFIYFWEYFHRLWARLMGFVFLIPFIIFWRKGWLDGPLMKRLGMTVLLAAVVASFGWIMVASGLVDRPWVNAYKLTMHLSLACILYAYLLWTLYKVWLPKPASAGLPAVARKWAMGIMWLLAVQIVLGGIMSGAKAALAYPSWPDMNGEWAPGVLFDINMWNVDNFVQYDATPFLSALIQFVHRTVAYVLTILILYFFLQYRKATSSALFRGSLYVLITVLISQVLLGIATVVSSVGIIPVGLGVLHQAGALAMLSVMLGVVYQLPASR